MAQRNSLTLLVLLAAFVTSALIYKNTDQRSKEETMLADLTIYLSGKILEDGGLVILLPQEIPIQLWNTESEYHNPTVDRQDQFNRSVLNEKDRRVGVIVNSQISVVILNYPESGNYRYRFAIRETTQTNQSNIQTLKISVGSGNGQHPLSGEVEPQPTIIGHHITSPSGTWSEDNSREVDAKTQLGFLKERYNCQQYAFAMSCDATTDKLSLKRTEQDNLGKDK